MASDEQVTVVAIMTPHPGKMDRACTPRTWDPIFTTPRRLIPTLSIELMTQATHLFRENGPGTIRYQIHVETKGEDRGESLVFIET